MKERGVLLPIFSLPSKYGVGDFGYEAYEFVDILCSNGIDYWEILPINACDNKPYSPLSFYALNTTYISLDKLKDDGLLDDIAVRPSTSRVKYDDFKMKYFYQAFGKFVPDDGFYKFIEKEEIKEYVEYVTRKFGGTREFHYFLQYKAYTQWMQLREYANSKNLRIIGDMPAYPVFNSTEAYFHSEFYEMVNGKYTFEAGAPPDYYNRNGQKWGNPVYDVANIKKDNYQYFIKRYEWFLHLFDIVRLDYFKGFDSFYKIPIGEPPENGVYCDGLSYGFFDALFKVPGIKVKDFIIEDLGDIREETVALRKRYEFTRQKVLQFTLDLNNLYDKDNVSDNAMVLTGTHDCKTIRTWYEDLSEEYKNNLKEFLREHECEFHDVSVGIMQYAMACKGRIAMLPVQDILWLDDDARINFPGTTSERNWSWKLVDFSGLRERLQLFDRHTVIKMDRPYVEEETPKSEETSEPEEAPQEQEVQNPQELEQQDEVAPDLESPQEIEEAQENTTNKDEDEDLNNDIDQYLQEFKDLNNFN
jgi:4-alpha-glucanotransferase